MRLPRATELRSWLPVLDRGAMDRSKDPSPFAWIFGGALALIGVAAGLRALRGATTHDREVVAQQGPPAEVEELLDPR